ncbi:MAG: hypothetical protein ACWA5W_06265, partial [Phycisphaerales bacterium]
LANQQPQQVLQLLG